VKVVSLDAYARAHQFEQISFMKVDVEGFEPLVFRGAEELLARAKVRAIFFEVCPDASRAAGFDPADAATILSSHGYTLHRITDDGGLKAVETEDAEHEVVTNWVALAPPHGPATSFVSHLMLRLNSCCDAITFADKVRILLEPCRHSRTRLRSAQDRTDVSSES
jgi:hypothetical protein